MSPAPRGRSPRRAFHRPTLDGAQAHREWLSLVEVSGPFLSLPVLRSVWPDLDPVDKPVREQLRREHGAWQTGLASDRAQARVVAQQSWIRYVLHDLLGWAETLRRGGLEGLAVEGETPIAPDFALVEPGAAPDADGDDVKPDTVRLLGLTCPPGQAPTARIPGDGWAATPVDRLAHLCRHHDVPLGLATDGRFWTLLHAPRQGTTTTATFDAVAWQEAAERTVVRAFVSLLCRSRFFGVPDDETLVPLFKRSEEQGEELTEALGVQVRQAVELLVAAIGRADLHERDLGRPGLQDVDAHDVYRGAVAVMMRIVFLLFAEERLLLPADNDLYLSAYSAGHLRADLEDRVTKGTEEELEHGTGAWHRLLALFEAVHAGIDHQRLTIHPHAGSLFDPEQYAWLPASIDDRTVLHMLRAVQRVQVGTGKSRETRTVSFRTLDVEQIGYVYEGLLAFEGFRADSVVVGLIGKEGLEEEVRLSDLETLAAKHPSVPALAAALAETYKESKIGSAKVLERMLLSLPESEREEARKKLLAVTSGDYPLAERLLPMYRIIRRDLRDLPVVVLPGALYVTESRLRGSTGAHYTPQFLAREVVKHTLQPLVYKKEQGPFQTADRSSWIPRSSAELLELKVADIAMGSAAFLVAAARYLGEHLVKAWVREGDERVANYFPAGNEQARDADADPVVVEARRQIIEHCLYGVDINAMAVEMAKLSLWLVSMDPMRSFTFVDDRLIVGDSLLGIASIAQLDSLHLEPVRGRLLNGPALDDWADAVPILVQEMEALRRQIVEAPDETEASGATPHKGDLLRAATERAARLRLVCNLIVGAGLSDRYHYTGNDRERARAEITDSNGRIRGDGRFSDLARLSHRIVHAEDDEVISDGLDSPGEVAREWLSTVPAATLHWPLSFPEVMAQGGFDAIIGNPPFIKGARLLPIFGQRYRDYLVQSVARGVRGTRGTADLVAYFVIRAHDLCAPSGQLGLVATNTLAQGDSRLVGLDQVVSEGSVIRRAVKSAPWPSKSAVLEYCVTWISRCAVGPSFKIVLDGSAVSGITSSLDPTSRASGDPRRLKRNAGLCIQGAKVWGEGFIVAPDEARAWIRARPVLSEVLAPYLGGQDLNSSPNLTAGRWVIDFHDFSLEKAALYGECFQQVVEKVKPEREKVENRKHVRDVWWQFAERRPELLAAIKGLGRVIVLAQTSKTAIPVFVENLQVYDQKVIVFASEDPFLLALLTSSPHYLWAMSRCSTWRTDLSYTPTSAFETLALPASTGELRDLGLQLDSVRREVMLKRQVGLTKLYNSVFDQDCSDANVRILRDLHRTIDEEVFRAYDWIDLLKNGLGHGFYRVGRDYRYTIAPPVQIEILDRLLELNQERYVVEVAAGLHEKRVGSRRVASLELAESVGEGQLF